METLKLYTYFRSSCSYRVRIALNLKNLPHEMIPVHLLKEGGQQHKSEYKDLNPSAQVPTLLQGNFLLGQSMAILEYLEETHPSPSLLPGSAKERAHIRQICEVINSGIQPLQNLAVLQHLSQQFQATDEQKKQWMQTWVLKGFESVEALLQKQVGNYAVGDQVSLADCLIVPQVFSAQRFQIDLSPFPKTLKVYERCVAMESFKKAAPDQQPDFEK